MPEDPYEGHHPASEEGQEAYWENFWDHVGEFGVLEFLWDKYFGDDEIIKDRDSG